MTSRTISTIFRVGARYRCSMSITLPIAPGIGGLRAEWEPDVPNRLTAAELRDYRRGRDALLAEVAQVLGGNVLVAE